ncbi:hypothetical protein GTA08_BOTSDO07576 [Neofusicoccum parvum]|uniref:Uncharacterized protein n=1 Tax=Neofusicoccum parvum TaxID=310453 RepID=A0ACB5RVW1_9PEZI|nr:hypothetical protein GTA08_BOTSDO07576 [Neofusicoccum parvum]
MGSQTTTCLITGTNRGIGKGLVAAYIARPRHTVIATVRDPAHASALQLRDLPTAEGTNLLIVQMDTASAESIIGAVSTLTDTHNIHHLDIVVANAGIGEPTGPLLTTPRSKIQEYVDVNAYGPLELFKATLCLLKGAATPKFVVISSNLASFALMNASCACGPYGASKAMVNFFVKWLSQEYSDIAVWSMHPGAVETDMGRNAIEYYAKNGNKYPLKWSSVEQSATGIQRVIDAATLKDTSGQYLSCDGNELPW